MSYWSSYKNAALVRRVQDFVSDLKDASIVEVTSASKPTDKKRKRNASHPKDQGEISTKTLTLLNLERKDNASHARKGKNTRNGCNNKPSPRKPRRRVPIPRVNWTKETFLEKAQVLYSG
ncbi:hypothetical protein OXX79_013978 [Metschnikowia pulcherrima]